MNQKKIAGKEVDGHVKRKFIEFDDHNDSKLSGYYTGNIKNGLPSDSDAIIEDTWGNIIYRGGLHKGKFDGFGSYFFNGYKIYEGTYKNGKYHGKGNENYLDGSTFHGSYLYGMKNGYGEYKSDNEEYEGNFLNGMYHGYGKYRYKNGYSYNGEYSFGKMNGNGRLETEERVYVGEFSNGFMHGKGECYYKKENRKVIGSFINGKETKGRLDLNGGEIEYGRFDRNREGILKDGPRKLVNIGKGQQK